LKTKLDKNKIDYIFFHLKQHIDLADDFLNKIQFIENDNKNINSSTGIVFKLSTNELIEDKIIYIDKIPVLFPVSNQQKSYTITHEGTLIFEHDFLKSAFYLLSGYQETQEFEPDQIGRFTYKSSLQFRLNIVNRAIVNEYFEIIINGLMEYARAHQFELKRKTPLAETFVFNLSHDVDRIDKYDFYYWGYKLKQIVGISPASQNKFKLILLFCKGFLLWLLGKYRPNPWWNFDYLREVERKYNFVSTFFFLPKHEKHVDAYYSFNEPRIKNLIQQLHDEGCEIGFHAPVEASVNLSLMRESLSRLKKIFSEIVGIRQHFLANKYPQTQILQQEAGFVYDTTLYFAEHEGFRNSYCFPFHPFDFEKNQMLDLWEIPLTVMDCTLFDYRKLSFEEAESSVLQIVEEVKKYHGIFGMLWHNSYFEEEEHRGIRNFYETIIRSISRLNPVCENTKNTLKLFTANC
jgi:hypothetical protein